MRTVISSSARDVARWLDQETAMIIDVREPEEAARACVPGALNMPLSAFALEDVPPAPDKRVVFICEEGVRSASAGQLVLDEGWLPEAYFVTGGMADWTRAGLPVGCL
ncbi:MAG: rhodanese-like domain-containing protein [Magnetovibrio sp.]|nr:rhodanese-like domain-containing protein [Magnetovibrio sp.]